MTADITKNEPRPLWKAEEAAQILGISTKTVHKPVREGKPAGVQATARDRQITYERAQEYLRPLSEDRERS